MSALTRDVLRPVRVKLSPEQVQSRRRQAEKILGVKKRSASDTKAATRKRD